jgi:hypothetical protein
MGGKNNRIFFAVFWKDSRTDSDELHDKSASEKIN